MTEAVKVEQIDGIDPLFVPYLLRGAMACRYASVAGVSYEDAIEDAQATWDTEWDSDPEPRTMQDAIAAVDSDLEHWEGD